MFSKFPPISGPDPTGYQFTDPVINERALDVREEKKASVHRLPSANHFVPLSAHLQDLLEMERVVHFRNMLTMFFFSLTINFVMHVHARTSSESVSSAKLS